MSQAEVRVIPARERSDAPSVESRLPTPRPTLDTRSPVPPSESVRSRRPSVSVRLPLSVELNSGNESVLVKMLGRPTGWAVRVETWNRVTAPRVLFDRAYETGEEAVEIYWRKVHQAIERMQM